MRIRQSLTTAAAAVLAAAGLLTVTPAPAEAASSLRIYRIYYDSPGTDTRSNTSLNAEYVMIKNYATTTKYLTNWTIRDNTGYVYKFPGTAIGAGKTVVLHTGKGTNSGAHRYWQRTNYVWNNTTDKATLKNSVGTVMHTCSYPDTTALYKNC
jgi:hypothetical protein